MTSDVGRRSGLNGSFCVGLHISGVVPKFAGVEQPVPAARRGDFGSKRLMCGDRHCVILTVGQYSS